MTDPYADSDDYNDLSENETSAPRELVVPPELGGERLDAALAKLLSDYSRSRLTAWIKDGQVQVDGKVVLLPKTKLLGGERLSIVETMSDEVLAYQPEPLELNIVYEDDAILVINKPAGMVVHPAAGNWTGTLLNGLLHHYPALAQVPRAGIVHRLDKDTSGLMVVAKTLQAQADLVRQLQARTVKRIYRAVADGNVPYDGTIDANIGRDPHNRLKMAVVKFGGKAAVTHMRVLERYTSHSYIECQLETGRTHQIRVHMKEARHPLAGDPVYGNPRHPMSEQVTELVKALKRQALHAFSLSLVHPVTGKEMTWKSKLPDDIRHLLSVLRDETGMASGHTTTRPSWAEDDSDEDWDDDDYDVEVHYVRE
ncbi:23S rRNA pseudouridine(1911/1915/1917) synthase RluD [Crenobacter sp. SG2303]|uniref:Pseudouridine synthase n=1 Tax=Crenobacter oryzisoli TaxID=3056844 RepID=A0ABT7XU52_9NEIS|nr:23S rRNA pseudouridine(1911/1915/1917) synthase RluD [Crenobacter sp. SG2303]MDN0077322.1 23S rRNA pseudouridine(1911/1915/1917) synthase RluD [Crenobacter sp. SG2303]